MKIIKSLLFYPLLWLRGIVLAVGRFISGICLFFVIVGIIIKSIDTGADIQWFQIVITAFMGLGIFILLEFYDQLLLKLNPTNYKLTLYK